MKDHFAEKSSINTFFKIWMDIYPIILPILVGIFPAIYYFSNNASIVLISSFFKIIGLITFIIFLLYLSILLFLKYEKFKCAIASCVLVLCLNYYGIIYRSLISLDFFRVEHFTLLPFLLVLTCYSFWQTKKMSDFISFSFWKNWTFILLGFSLFNLIKNIPTQILENKTGNFTAAEFSKTESLEQNLPDIYYIVFDEFSGFEPIRSYFKYQDIDIFKQFLISSGFYILEDIKSNSLHTVYELATRLNYEKYECCDKINYYFEAISNNKVSGYLKSKGYTIIAFEEMRYSFPTEHPFKADILFDHAPDETINMSDTMDDFSILVLDNTILYIDPSLYKKNKTDVGLQIHKRMIDFTIDKVGDFSEITSPKFIYVHLLFPHMPFMFDKDGNIIDSQYRNNWHYYFDNYLYSTKVIKQMITNIFAVSTTKVPPIIILQSDHGARNEVVNVNDVNPNINPLLEDYPEAFKYSILYALYIPGYPYYTLPQDLDPINTFPLVFNYLFNENIPIK